jgi:hypothetical protein
MQRPETWVRVNQHRALKRLADHLADGGGPDEAPETSSPRHVTPAPRYTM